MNFGGKGERRKEKNGREGIVRWIGSKYIIYI